MPRKNSKHNLSPKVIITIFVAAVFALFVFSFFKSQKTLPSVAEIRSQDTCQNNISNLTISDECEDRGTFKQASYSCLNKEIKYDIATKGKCISYQEAFNKALEICGQTCDAAVGNINNSSSNPDLQIPSTARPAPMPIPPGDLQNKPNIKEEVPSSPDPSITPVDTQTSTPISQEVIINDGCYAIKRICPISIIGYQCKPKIVCPEPTPSNPSRGGSYSPISPYPSVPQSPSNNSFLACYQFCKDGINKNMFSCAIKCLRRQP